MAEYRWALGLAAFSVAIVGGLIAARSIKKQPAAPQVQLQELPAAPPTASRRPEAEPADAQPTSAYPAAPVAPSRKDSRSRALARAHPTPTPAQSLAYESAAGFYPLPYGSGLGLDEGWEMVRVNMPVSALASLGVPLTHGASTGHYVQADVVLGGDGLARAIRFVH